MFKTVKDAWNAYHVVQLREGDKYLTTFVTLFGRFRYARIPQDFVSSGVSYNRCFVAILSYFHRKERYVDGTIYFIQSQSVTGSERYIFCQMLAMQASFLIRRNSTFVKGSLILPDLEWLMNVLSICLNIWTPFAIFQPKICLRYMELLWSDKSSLKLYQTS